MTLLYQPLSRTFGQRDGCLTPSNHEEKAIVPKSFALSESHEILSPPLSPYQKDKHEDRTTIDNALGDNKTFTHQYLQTPLAFKVEKFTSYLLTVAPWTNLAAGYKSRQLLFLRQYANSPSSSSSRLQSVQSVRLGDRRALHASAARKKPVRTVSSDSDTDATERVRTRRVVKESLVPISEMSEAPPSPKKRKVRREPYAGSPLAAQQAALIDESIPDYLPDAAATLPKGNTRCLKIEWKGQPMDLRDDASLSQLHPAEVVLASTLRLPCNVYLDLKRRLFYEKVKRMRSGMPFRRTDAQKACRIDVNKASRLFAAFEKVGWLDDAHFARYV